MRNRFESLIWKTSVAAVAVIVVSAMVWFAKADGDDYEGVQASEDETSILSTTTDLLKLFSPRSGPCLNQDCDR